MMDVALEYGLFLAQALTVVAAVGAVIVIAAGAARRQQPEPGIEVQRLNERFDDLARPLHEKVLPAKAFKAEQKKRKKARKAAAKAERDDTRTCVFVLDFKGDMRASAGRNLREEVSAIVAMAGEHDQVLLRLENTGGMVHEHGFAASQLARLRARGIRLTVAVDKVAASGGYMMACIGDHILAAPFAILGSIGVLAQVPNLNRLLKDKGVDFEQFKGGRYKRTVTVFGENTDEDREKFQQEIEEIHTLFKQFVAEHRPQLDMDRVATGEHWFARDAIALDLCDEIGTSDDWLLARRGEAELLRVRYRAREPLGRRIAHAVEDAPARALDRVIERLWESRTRG
jgi:serine protease SohB